MKVRPKAAVEEGWAREKDKRDTYQKHKKRKVEEVTEFGLSRVQSITDTPTLSFSNVCC